MKNYFVRFIRRWRNKLDEVRRPGNFWRFQVSTRSAVVYPFQSGQATAIAELFKRAWQMLSFFIGHPLLLLRAFIVVVVKAF